ncbi:MAG: hypothetical protein JXD19_00060 [Deltaproteobacteria bacterium]|nr:hypothetical protein [Deltaproteobacteria bacterium]
MTGKKNSSVGSKLKAAEKELTKGILRWAIKRKGMPPADEENLDRGSERIVEEAHRIVKTHSRGVWSELKKAKEEFVKASRGEDTE